MNKLTKRIIFNIPGLYNFLVHKREKDYAREIVNDKKFIQMEERAKEIMPSLCYIEDLLHECSEQPQRRYDFLEAVILDEICLYKKTWEECDKTEPIFICFVKNDLQRVRIQYQNLLKLGIKKFVYVDNGSDDGTLEWLEGKNNVNIFKVKAKYNSNRRYAWLRKITDYYGYDRWYLIMDSDEVFSYPGQEQYNVQQYIELLEKNRMRSSAAIMLDMYTNGKLFSNEPLNDKEIEERYSWFDINSFERATRNDCLYYEGGPRKKVFFKNDVHSPALNKYPLVRLKVTDFYTYHNVRTKEKDMDKKLHCVLLHYKFLPQDNIRYEMIVNESNYANGSAEYKKYLEERNSGRELSFYNSKSVKLNCSKELFKISGFDSKLYKKWNLK